MRAASLDLQSGKGPRDQRRRNFFGWKNTDAENTMVFCCDFDRFTVACQVNMGRPSSKFCPHTLQVFHVAMPKSGWSSNAGAKVDHRAPHGCMAKRLMSKLVPNMDRIGIEEDFLIGFGDPSISESLLFQTTTHLWHSLNQGATS